MIIRLPHFLWKEQRKLHQKKLPRAPYELWRLPRKTKKEICKKYGKDVYLKTRLFYQIELLHKCSYDTPPLDSVIESVHFDFPFDMPRD